MKTIYTARMPWGEKIIFRANLSEASAPIEQWDEDLEDWKSTPFQTADARHDEHEMVKIMLEWIGRDYYAEPDDDRDNEAILEYIMKFVTITEKEKEE